MLNIFVVIFILFFFCSKVSWDENQFCDLHDDTMRRKFFLILLWLYEIQENNIMCNLNSMLVEEIFYKEMKECFKKILVKSFTYFALVLIFNYYFKNVYFYKKENKKKICKLIYQCFKSLSFLMFFFFCHKNHIL